MITVVEESESVSVEATLQQLSDHYRQPIHRTADVPPYFDPILGSSLAVPPILQHWLNDLIILEDWERHILEWLNGYTSHVRPVLIPSQNDHDGTGIHGIPILVHYEIGLSQWLQTKDQSNSEPNQQSSLIIHPKVDPSVVNTIADTISMLATDITVITAREKSLTQYKIANIVIPTLFRLILHAFQIYDLVKDQRSIRKDALIRCFVSTMAFAAQQPEILPTTLLGTLCHPVALESTCSYQPTDAIPAHRSTIESCLSLETLDWKSLAINDCVWNDATTGVTSRVVKLVWSNLKSLLQAAQSTSIDAKIAELSLINDTANTSTNTTPTTDGSACVDVTSCCREIYSTIGVTHLAKAIRAHFFGRDLFMMKDDCITQTRMIMGRSVTREEPRMKDQRPYVEIPSRIHVVAFFLQLLSADECTSNDTFGVLLEELLPVWYQLVDSAFSNHVAVGACGIIRLLDCSSSSEHIDSTIWHEYAETCFSVLNQAVISSDDATAQVVLGQALCKLFAQWPPGASRRRKVTQKWIQSLEYTSNRIASKMKLKELLLGGIIPLLYQHASMPSADSLELGTLGLAALLPLVKGEFVDTATQIAATVALINLFMGAYPVVPFHGEKIMRALLLLIAETKQITYPNEKETALQFLSRHAAAIALILCDMPHAGGINRAQTVLDEILDSSGKYKVELIDAAQEIVTLSKIIPRT